MSSNEKSHHMHEHSLNLTWFFLVPLIWMDFVKDFHPGCVGKFPFVFRLAESWERVSLEGTALKWPLLSLVFFFHLRMRGVRRHETLPQFFSSVVFRLTLIGFDRMMEVREYHYWHAGERWDMAHAACLWLSVTIANSACPRGTVWSDESLLWSIGLWSAITVPCGHSCSLRLKCCSLTNAVWFGWKMNVSMRKHCPRLKCLHHNKHLSHRRLTHTNSVFSTLSAVIAVFNLRLNFFWRGPCRAGPKRDTALWCEMKTLSVWGYRSRCNYLCRHKSHGREIACCNLLLWHWLQCLSRFLAALHHSC